MASAGASGHWVRAPSVMSTRHAPAAAVATVALFGACLLSGCGGGSDDSANDAIKSPSAATADAERVKPTPRRARAYDLTGVTSIVMSRDGANVGIAHANGSVVLQNAAGREIKKLKPAGGAAAVGLVFSGDGRLLVAVSRDSVATAYSVETGEKRFAMQGHEHALRSVAASADGSLIATGGEETRVLLWDGSTGRLKHILRGPTDFVNSVSVSPDGRTVAGGDASATVWLWSAANGRVLHSLRGHAGEVNAVTFNSNGSQLASAGEDGKVLVWDVASGSAVGALAGQRSAVRSLAYNADSGLLASGAVDGKVMVWDVATKAVVQDVGGGAAGGLPINAIGGSPAARAITSPISPAAAINALAFAPGSGGQLLLGNNNSTAALTTSVAMPNRPVGSVPVGSAPAITPLLPVPPLP